MHSWQNALILTDRRQTIILMLIFHQKYLYIGINVYVHVAALNCPHPPVVK